MNRTKIEWTHYTWNPVTGCLNTCWYCYVRRMEEKYGYSRLPQFHEDRLQAPRTARPGSRILVCSTADLFAPWIPDEWITRVREVVLTRSDVTFQFLTKFPERYARWGWPWYCWLGTTVESPEHVDRLEALARLPNLRFVSFEPLLDDVAPGLQAGMMAQLKWIIIGAITGGRREAYLPHRTWITGLIEVADRAGTSVFLKDNLRRLWNGPLRQEYPEPLYPGRLSRLEESALCDIPHTVSNHKEGEDGQIFE